MSQSEVENMLCKSKTYYFCTNENVKCLSYLLGMCTHKMINQLFLCFNKQNILTSIDLDFDCSPAIYYNKETKEQFCRNLDSKDGLQPFKSDCRLVPW